MATLALLIIEQPLAMNCDALLAFGSLRGLDSESVNDADIIVRDGGLLITIEPLCNSVSCWPTENQTSISSPSYRLHRESLAGNGNVLSPEHPIFG